MAFHATWIYIMETDYHFNTRFCNTPDRSGRVRITEWRVVLSLFVTTDWFQKKKTGYVENCGFCALRVGLLSPAPSQRWRPCADIFSLFGGSRYLSVNVLPISVIIRAVTTMINPARKNLFWASVRGGNRWASTRRCYQGRLERRSLVSYLFDVFSFDVHWMKWVVIEIQNPDRHGFSYIQPKL